MKESLFLSSDQVREKYSEIIPVYQKAFAGEPWYEVSKCVSSSSVAKKCQSGYSPLKVGERCRDCGLCTKEEAYPAMELVAQFDKSGQRQSLWYVESASEGLTTVAFAWVATPEEAAKEKYADNLAMSEWLYSTLGSGQIIWFDDWFSDLQLSPSGNMKNFGFVVQELMARLGARTLAFRTINPRVIRSALRDLSDNVRIYQAGKDVPDWRDFVVIKI